MKLPGTSTFTVTLSVPVPPGPVHVRVNIVLLAVMAADVCDPEKALAPDQAPEAVQEVTVLVVVQDKLTVLPETTLTGPFDPLARISTTGAWLVKFRI